MVASLSTFSSRFQTRFDTLSFTFSFATTTTTFISSCGGTRADESVVFAVGGRVGKQFGDGGRRFVGRDATRGLGIGGGKGLGRDCSTLSSTSAIASFCSPTLFPTRFALFTFSSTLSAFSPFGFASVFVSNEGHLLVLRVLSLKDSRLVYASSGNRGYGRGF